MSESLIPRSMAEDTFEPIVLGHYTLGLTGLVVKGKPSFEEHEQAGRFIRGFLKASPWWYADWMRYGDSRADWNAKIAQTMGALGISEKRAKNIRSVGAIEPSRRRDDVEFGLHEVVAGLQPEDQTHWLHEASAYGWDRRELRMQIRASRRRKILEGQAVLSGMFRVLMVDPPWSYKDRPPSGSGQADHYPGMTIDQMCKLPVAAHCYPNAVMFMWVTASMVYYSSDGLTPDPYRLITAWGFEPKTNQIWDKVLSAGGHYVASKHEHLFICTRGSCLPDRPVPQPDSVITERRPTDFMHSEKPESFRKQIEQLYDGPRVELFAREKHDGWTAFGNDSALWAEEVHA